MRVLLVNTSLDPVTGGGMAQRTSSLCAALTALGVQTSALVLDLGLSGEVRARLPDTELVALRCVGRRYYLPEPALGRIERAVGSADIVHITGHWTLLGALAHRAARRSGVPHVVSPVGALPLFGRSTTLKRAYNRAVGREIVRTAAARIAVTDSERASFAAYGVDPASVVVIPNGITPEDFAPPGPAAHAALVARIGGEPRPYVLFMGRLNPIKGPDLLLSAAVAARDDLGDVRFVFAGPDEGMAAALRARAAAARMGDRVVLTGPLGGSVKIAAYHAALLLAVPSRQEAMSLVALEAGASGTPVLLTEACGFPEVERAGGGLVVPASADGLADGLRRMLCDPEQLAQTGRRLRDLVLTHYTWRHAARAHLEVYRGLTGAATGSPSRP